MTIRDWLVHARLAWEETRHVVERTIRPTGSGSTPNTIQLENRVLLSASPAPVMVDGDAQPTDTTGELSRDGLSTGGADRHERAAE